MKRILTSRKILFAAIGIIVLLILYRLEYDHFRLSKIVYVIIWIIVPLLIGKYFPKKKSVINYILVTVVVITYLATFLVGLVMITGFCNYGNQETWYVNKNNKSVKIIKRNYACFETDNDTELFKERKLTNHISWVTGFNENPIDTSVWLKVDYGYDN
jgi:hypothetical protein